MAEADADDADAAALEQAAGVLDQPEDPLVGLEAVVLGARDEHGVDGLGVRVGRLVAVDHVVRRQVQLGPQRLVRPAARPPEQVREDAAVALVVVLGLHRRDGRVGLENREPDRRRCDLGAHSFCDVYVCMRVCVGLCLLVGTAVSAFD